jgi:rhodanese-related sulfurtransferase
VKLAARGEAVLVDVRAKLAWEGSHAEGALSIPSSEMAARIAELPKDKLIVAYCT